ncbi:hypothetical protein Dvina_23350 [Dactylosporangium vinaceum]|uniref:CBM6 domain-containing protein n=1 Tax=Dactylosporangium vinaceum TaxID=53362 RepID=A0ABV5MCU4_9ACTN|nr:hypothetical protein [Dactylosporangium vinaceum]UAC00726.1 hypothetical protein Dvina_23350 [Dactylosporangium vinaceum]
MDVIRRWLGASVVGLAVAATALVLPAVLPSASPMPYTAPSAVPSAASPAAPIHPTFPKLVVAAADPGNERHGVETTACPTCASGSRVQYVGQGHALVVPITSPVAGRRTLTIVYESNGPRPLHVIVGDQPTVQLSLPGKGSWTEPARVELPIDLPAGDTVIRLFHPDRPAPDLDQLIIA